MTDNFTRFNIPRDPRNPVDHIDSGYEGATLDDGITIPSCEIEDVDRAMKLLFDKDIGFAANTVYNKIEGSDDIKSVKLSKPFVIMATGERFALVKRLRPPRDRNQALLLPAISIRRTSIAQTPEDFVGRGMNQSTGNLVIKRRLDSSDRDYQNLINKIGLQNAQLTPSSIRPEIGSEGRTVNAATQQGILLDPNLGNNVFEIITIPQPQFYTATYEIVFWTSYTQHMNYLIMTLFSSFLPQGKMFRLNTDKGYWFIAYVEDEFANQENIDDFVDQEKVVRYSFTMKVKSFVLAANGPGNAVPIRRHISAPQIDFELEAVTDQVIGKSQIPTSDDQFVLSNIGEEPTKTETETTEKKFLVKKTSIDPRTGKQQTKYVKIMERNQKKGETIYTTSGVTSLDEFLLTIK